MLVEWLRWTTQYAQIRLILSREIITDCLGGHRSP